MSTEQVPGIVSLGSDGQASAGNADTSGCYESCDASGCDCFDSGDCFDACDTAPNP